MRRYLGRLREARRDDEGSALIIVLGAMTVAMLVASVALGYAMQTSSGAQRSTAWNQAFAAAQAGVDDYLARLNKDDNYWLTVDCSNRALEGSTTRTNSCGWGSGTDPDWLPVQGSDRAYFHYDVDVSSTPVNGTIHIVSTGRVDTVTRTIDVTLRRGGFGEFLYATTYETTDPADYSNPVQKYAQCAKYFWAGRTGCEDITFIGGDKLNGPVHSNDSILMTDGTSTNPKGPWFTGTVTTSNPSCKPVNGVPKAATSCFRNGNSYGTASPRFDKGIAYRSEIELPESIGDLRQYVVPPSPLPAGWTAAGCRYTGTTRIKFESSGTAAGTMKVWSPASSQGTVNTNCWGTAVGGQTWPRTVPVPENGLVFVENVPSTQTQPASGACAAGVLGKVPDTTTGASLPRADDYNQTLDEADCRLGTAYVEGTLKGRVTVSAENNVVITGNLVYRGGETGTDALGLIAENSVQVYHPISTSCAEYSWVWVPSGWWSGSWERGPCVDWRRGSSNLGGSITNPTVHAAILTLQHSFEVQQYDVGANLGRLRVFGSIAQKFRGPVGKGSAGYLKDYNYDSRLRYAPPPYFLDPVRSAWGQKTFGEIAPRYGD